MEKKVIQCDRCTTEISEQVFSPTKEDSPTKLLVPFSITAKISATAPFPKTGTASCPLDEMEFCSPKCLLEAIKDWLADVQKAIDSGFETTEGEPS